MFKVNNKDTRTTPKFERLLHFVLVFLLLPPGEIMNAKCVFEVRQLQADFQIIWCRGNELLWITYSSGH